MGRGGCCVTAGGGGARGNSELLRCGMAHAALKEHAKSACKRQRAFSALHVKRRCGSSLQPG
eukprot:365747-Chlamydomonas_euryale.AAC.67